MFVDLSAEIKTFLTVSLFLYLPAVFISSYLRSNFKERQRNHKRDFKYQKHRNCAELAKYVWELNEKNIIQKYQIENIK